MRQTFITTINAPSFTLPSEFISGSTRIVRFIACQAIYNDPRATIKNNDTVFQACRKSDPSQIVTIDPAKIILHSNLVQGSIGSQTDVCNDFVSFCNLGFRNERTFYIVKNIRSLSFWFDYIDPDILIRPDYMHFVIELELLS